MLPIHRDPLTRRASRGDLSPMGRGDPSKPMRSRQESRVMLADHAAIDDVLETNAEDFVKAYVQKGGQ